MFSRYVSKTLSFDEYKVILEAMLYDKCYREGGRSLEESESAATESPAYDIMSWCTNRDGKARDITWFNAYNSSYILVNRQTSRYNTLIARYMLYSLGLMEPDDASEEVGDNGSRISPIKTITHYCANKILELGLSPEYKIIQDKDPFSEYFAALSKYDDNEKVDVVEREIYKVLNDNVETRCLDKYISDYLNGTSLQSLQVSSIVSKYDIVFRWAYENGGSREVFFDTDSKNHYSKIYSAIVERYSLITDNFMENDNSYAQMNGVYDKVRTMVGRSLDARFKEIAPYIYSGGIENTEIEKSDDDNLDYTNKFAAISDNSIDGVDSDIGELLSTARSADKFVNNSRESDFPIYMFEFVQQQYAQKFFDRFAEEYRKFLRGYDKKSALNGINNGCYLIMKDKYKVHEQKRRSDDSIDRSLANALVIPISDTFVEKSESPSMARRLCLMTTWSDPKFIQFGSKKEAAAALTPRLKHYDNVQKSKTSLTKTSIMHNTVSFKDSKKVTYDAIVSLMMEFVSSYAISQANDFSIMIESWSISKKQEVFGSIYTRPLLRSIDKMIKNRWINEIIENIRADEEASYIFRYCARSNSDAALVKMVEEMLTFLALIPYEKYVAGIEPKYGKDSLLIDLIGDVDSNKFLTNLSKYPMQIEYLYPDFKNKVQECIQSDEYRAKFNVTINPKLHMVNVLRNLRSKFVPSMNVLRLAHDDIKSYCGRLFSERDITEFFNDPSINSVVMKKSPTTKDDFKGFALMYSSFSSLIDNRRSIVRDDEVCNGLDTVYATMAYDKIGAKLHRAGLTVMDLPSTHDLDYMGDMAEDNVFRDITDAKSLLRVRRRIREGIYTRDSHNQFSTDMFTEITDLPGISSDLFNINNHRMVQLDKSIKNTNLTKTKNEYSDINSGVAAIMGGTKDESDITQAIRALDSFNVVKGKTKPSDSRQSIVETKLRDAVARTIYQIDPMAQSKNDTSFRDAPDLLPVNFHTMSSSHIGKYLAVDDGMIALSLMINGYNEAIHGYDTLRLDRFDFSSKIYSFLQTVPGIVDSLNLFGEEKQESTGNNTVEHTFEFTKGIAKRTKTYRSPIDSAIIKTEMHNIIANSISEVYKRSRDDTAVNKFEADLNKIPIDKKPAVIHEVVTQLVKQDIMGSVRPSSDLSKIFTMLENWPLLSVSGQNYHTPNSIANSVLEKCLTFNDSVYVLGIITYLKSASGLVQGDDIYRNIINSLRGLFRHLTKRLEKFNRRSRRLLESYYRNNENESFTANDFDKCLGVYEGSYELLHVNDIIELLSIIQDTLLVLGYYSSQYIDIICGAGQTFSLIKDGSSVITAGMPKLNFKKYEYMLNVRTIEGPPELPTQMNIVERLQCLISNLKYDDILKLQLVVDLLQSSWKSDMPFIYLNPETDRFEYSIKRETKIGLVNGKMGRISSPVTLDKDPDEYRVQSLILEMMKTIDIGTFRMMYEAADKNDFTTMYKIGMGANLVQKNLSGADKQAAAQELYIKLANHIIAKGSIAVFDKNGIETGRGGISSEDLKSSRNKVCSSILPVRITVDGFDELYVIQGRPISDALNQLASYSEFKQIVLDMKLTNSNVTTVSNDSQKSMVTAGRNTYDVLYRNTSEIGILFTGCGMKHIALSRSSSYIQLTYMITKSGDISAVDINSEIYSIAHRSLMLLQDKFVSVASEADKLGYHLDSKVLNDKRIQSGISFDKWLLIKYELQTINNFVTNEMEQLQHLKWLHETVETTRVPTQRSKTNGAILRARLFVTSVVSIASVYDNYSRLVKLMNASRSILVDAEKIQLSNVSDIERHLPTVNRFVEALRKVGLNVSMDLNSQVSRQDELMSCLKTCYLIATALTLLFSEMRLDRYNEHLGERLRLVSECFDSVMPLSDIRGPFLMKLMSQFSEYEDIISEAYHEGIKSIAYGGSNIKSNHHYKWGLVCSKFSGNGNDLASWNGEELLLYRGQRLFPDKNGEFNQIYLKNGMAIVLCKDSDSEDGRYTYAQCYDAAQRGNLDALLNL